MWRGSEGGVGDSGISCTVKTRLKLYHHQPFSTWDIS